jgi:chorismate mutase/prephenate dehydratase
MDAKERLESLRKSIDRVDDQIMNLFRERMKLSLQAGELKISNNLALVDEERERTIVERLTAGMDGHLSGEAALLMRSVMALSREYQRKSLTNGHSPLLPAAGQARENPVCAFQGVPGAWSEAALMKAFPASEKIAVDTFEDVFLAVKEQKADYGVAPIDNSRTGAIGETYDLLRKYGCFVVGKIQVPIHHCLMAPKEVKLEDVREVLSHPEAFSQCRNFLRGKSWDLTACRNTAAAAEKVAESAGRRSAAIGSRRAAELYNLNILVDGIMDDSENRTSFVVIALKPEYDSSCDTVSLTFATPHRAGALCEALLPFMAMGIDLNRIESRPATMGNYRFFVEIQGHIEDQPVRLSLSQAASVCEYFEVIGCYKNV